MAIKRNTSPSELAFQNYIEKSEKKLDELKHSLLIDKDDLDNELIHQPELYYQVGEHYAEAISVRDEAKYNRDKEHAELDRLVRREASDNSEKITEAQVLARIKENPSYDEVNSRYSILVRNAEFWLALKESYQQRSYALKDLVQLWISSYFTDSVGRVERNDVRDNRADQARRNLSEARNRAGYSNRS